MNAILFYLNRGSIFFLFCRRVLNLVPRRLHRQQSPGGARFAAPRFAAVRPHALWRPRRQLPHTHLPPTTRQPQTTSQSTNKPPTAHQPNDSHRPTDHHNSPKQRHLTVTPFIESGSLTFTESQCLQCLLGMQICYHCTLSNHDQSIITIY